MPAILSPTCLSAEALFELEPASPMLWPTPFTPTTPLATLLTDPAKPAVPPILPLRVSTDRETVTSRVLLTLPVIPPTIDVPPAGPQSGPPSAPDTIPPRPPAPPPSRSPACAGIAVNTEPASAIARNLVLSMMILPLPRDLSVPSVRENGADRALHPGRRKKLAQADQLGHHAASPADDAATNLALARHGFRRQLSRRSGRGKARGDERSSEAGPPDGRIALARQGRDQISARSGKIQMAGAASFDQGA